VKPETDSDGTVALIRLLGLTKIISKYYRAKFPSRVSKHAHHKSKMAAAAILNN